MPTINGTPAQEPATKDMMPTRKAVSVSLGSSKRDHTTTLTILGQQVQLSRIGCDGDLKKATEMYSTFDKDPTVSCLSVGGADMEVSFNGRVFEVQSVKKLFAGVEKTTLVDGSGIKRTLEAKAAEFVEKNVPIETLGPKYLPEAPSSTESQGSKQILKDKVIVTNTTTEADRALFKAHGLKYLVLTTPLTPGGRSFGTNVLEAAFNAALRGQKGDKKLSDEELLKALEDAGMGDLQLVEL
ncbi:hypothetical protein HDV05_005431 [Chytridiales sp. JEL 0842]|nr:hypothetical protein HDV05_005431 [Chytridiales sp. JEL 0842]